MKFGCVLADLVQYAEAWANMGKLVMVAGQLSDLALLAIGLMRSGPEVGAVAHLKVVVQPWMPPTSGNPLRAL